MRMNTDLAKKILEQNAVAIPAAVEDGVCFMVREQEALDAISAALEAALPHLAVVKQDLTAAPEAGNPVSVGQGEGVADKGPWQVYAGEPGSLISDDFTHDVMLRVCGDFRSDAELASYCERLAAHLNSTQPAPQSEPAVTIDDALAAGDGTLHGAVDYWQSRALAAEAKLSQPAAPESLRRLVIKYQSYFDLAKFPDVFFAELAAMFGRNPIGAEHVQAVAYSKSEWIK